jgi:hypothetical protein
MRHPVRADVARHEAIIEIDFARKAGVMIGILEALELYAVSHYVDLVPVYASAHEVTLE